MVDADELARLLADTVLGGRTIETAGAGTLAVRCDAEEVWSAWRAGAKARDLAASGATFTEVERLRLERRVAAASVPPNRIPVPEVFTDRDLVWFTPSGQPCAVVFMACESPWEALAHVGYHPVDGDAQRHAALVAVARGWHERYGAELVAAWGTMLQFTVPRPPTGVDAAWQLAGQHLAVGGSLQMDRSDLALALLQTDSWFLHDRP